MNLFGCSISSFRVLQPIQVIIMITQKLGVSHWNRFRYGISIEKMSPLFKKLKSPYFELY